MTDKVIVFSSCATVDEAERIARHLLDLKLAACVTITPGLRSIYRWQGAVEDSSELGLAIKTRRDLLPVLQKELRKVHSYDTPELLAVPVIDGSSAYLEWMDRELKPSPE